MGWKAVVLFYAAGGQKHDLRHPRGRGHLQSLAASGHLIGIFWCFSSLRGLENVMIGRSRRKRVPLSEELEQQELENEVSAIAESVQCVLARRPNAAVMVGATLISPEYQQLCLRLKSALPFHSSFDRCVYDRIGWLSTVSLLSTFSDTTSLQRLCPGWRAEAFHTTEKTASTHYHHVVPSWASSVDRRPLGSGAARRIAHLWSRPLRHLHEAVDGDATDRSTCVPGSQARFVGELPPGSRRVLTVPQLLWLAARKPGRDGRPPLRVEG